MEIIAQIILRCDLYSTLYGNGKYFLLHLWLGICICLTFFLRKKSCINFNIIVNTKSEELYTYSDVIKTNNIVENK